MTHSGLFSSVPLSFDRRSANCDLEMEALVKKAKGKGKIELMDYPIPQVKEGYALIGVKAVGICGSDLEIYRDEHPYFPPVVLGHEFSGEIVEVGPGVQGWKEGNRVVSEVHGLVCGYCRFCLSGERHVCPSKRALGWGIDGGFAEYVKVPAWLLHRIRDDVTFEEVALLEPTAIAVHGILERAKVEPRISWLSWVAVLWGSSPSRWLRPRVHRESSSQGSIRMKS